MLAVIGFFVMISISFCFPQTHTGKLLSQTHYRDNFISAEEVHNSRISANYARLINPESRVRDIVKESKRFQPY